jgi:hypothetical protein
VGVDDAGGLSFVRLFDNRHTRHYCERWFENHGSWVRMMQVHFLSLLQLLCTKCYVLLMSITIPAHICMVHIVLLTLHRV